ncbi:MAG: hypothetical protein UR66_C0014G0017 [Candidatus Moranbacteria bacterium GW2011_GWE1_35_17]|nr:MAG: hypothetical protein UR66_C0014G0017 [Candidatus Moranbacteria bacterium GW2011_GWE1_35_17]KKP82795.1 MAG: hypothetical protein UR82_C0031G0003 [Candidatus Moranbacteria bacterium GW2011_GWF1_35_5]
MKFGLPDIFARDISFVIFFLLISVAFGMLIGRFRLINVLINVYIAIAVLTVMPKDIFLPHSIVALLFFVVAVVVLTMVDSHLFDIHISGSGGSFFWRLFVMSFFEAGLIFSVLISFWDKTTLLKFISVDIYNLYVSEYARIFWMLAPLFILFFINKKEKK